MIKKYLIILVAMVFATNVMAQNVPSFVPKDGLIGYWPFNGNANDESGNGNHGTVNGATLESDRYSNVNSSYSFLNTNSKISLTTISSDSVSSISVSGWFKKSIAGIDAAIFAMSNGCNGADGLRLFIGNDNFLYWGLEKTSCVGVSVYSNLINYADNNWHFFVASYNKTHPIYVTKDFSLWIDGVKVGIPNTNSIQGINSPISNDLFSTTIGNHNLSSNRFTGQLDDIAIYNRALSDQEVKQLYEGCTKETATSSNFNSLLLSTGSSFTLSAEPQGGVFTGASIDSNKFVPSKAKIGANKVQYNFKNSQGCADSTLFTMIVADTVGTTCKKYDTITIKNNVYDTVKVTKFDTVTVTNNVTKYDTVTVTKFDTITVTNNVTKYDTLKVTKFDTVTVKNNVYDTVTITNNVTKYDTITTNVTKYDTVSILKIKFKLTTGINANQLSSLSIYPNPTTDVLHIEVPDAKALEGYRYRILDALGKEVYNQLVTQSTTEIPLKSLGAAGIYQFEILDATKTSIQSNKIVLQ